ncbi:MAG: cbb3-type cytochrome c oxidase subunit 3 [Thiofilum sp.]|uniref:cbb3-type cytochrome oxidase subunit 3 n=1 Tax=Thiofilum sp. TaxID=2212733 RepID=UPI0025DF1F4C|nr:cbb3-type cytochrome c oxidase subunit 3 [Thiofilum sp.]MBK8453457.1 cbb3-type cytochrome c oxidase subunit 3 [Thiofilum sp.]
MLTNAWLWLTDLGNSKVLALLIFFVTFVGIVLYVYTNRQRSERLESYKFLPLQDDDAPQVPHAEQQTKGEK